MTFDIPNLSLMQNPTVVFNNTIGADELSVNLPITYKDDVIGIITALNEEKIYCSIWDRFVKFYPVFHAKDETDTFKLSGINITLAIDEVMRLRETEDYVAIEIYKQFMRDNPSECAKVRKQILKKQPVDYFKQSNMK